MWIYAVFGLVLMGLALWALLLAERGEDRGYFARKSFEVGLSWVAFAVLMLVVLMWLAIASDYFTFQRWMLAVTMVGIGLWVGNFQVYNMAAYRTRSQRSSR